MHFIQKMFVVGMGVEIRIMWCVVIAEDETILSILEMVSVAKVVHLIIFKHIGFDFAEILYQSFMPHGAGLSLSRT